MKYKEHLQLTHQKRIDFVKEIIKQEDLATKRKPESISMKRYFLIHYLRANTSLSLVEIGAMFNRHHTTMISALESHHDLTETNDVKYVNYTESIKEYFKHVGEIDDTNKILRDKIRSADTLEEFYSIRERVVNEEL